MTACRMLLVGVGVVGVGDDITVGGAVVGDVVVGSSTSRQKVVDVLA